MKKSQYTLNIILSFLTFITITSFQEQRKSWVALGDSITYLNDHQNETGNRITKGYMSMVTEKLSEYEFVNKGYNGWTIINIAREIENLGLKKADLYTVFLGTNDWWGGNKLGTWEDYINATGTQTVMGAYRVITDKLKSLNPNAHVILITPMQRVDFVYIDNMNNNALGSYQAKDGQYLESFAEAIKKIATYEKFDVIDLYHNKKLSQSHLVKFKKLKDPQTGEYKNYRWPDYIGKPFNPEKDDYPYPVDAINMTYDGLHPSDKGYMVISNELINKMKRLK